MIHRLRTWLPVAIIALLAVWLYWLHSDIAAALEDVSMKDVAETFGVATVIMAALIVPYSLAALLVFEKDARIREVHRSKNARYWPSLWITTWMTLANFVGMLIVVTGVVVRMWLHYDTVAEVSPQPSWSLATSMVISAVIIGLLALPASFLLWVKYQILNLRYVPRDNEIRREDR